MKFSKSILNWYHDHKRELPWRTTKDPYRIWLSEIILQQTRVEQGRPYYERFLRAFPTVWALAQASEDEVLKLWQGLGYYSRARNMHSAAKTIVEQHDGIFPSTYEDLLKLKGVGDYTASAIASICFGEQKAVVDGNVFRVLARYFGVDIPINSTEGVKYFRNLAQRVADKEEIADYNQGIMEFGAMQCAPKKPYCLLCPLKDGCLALAQGKIQQLPVKVKKGTIKLRYFNFVVFLDPAERTLLQRREGKGIWQGLYQFPLIEGKSPFQRAEIVQQIKEDFPAYEPVSVDRFNDDPILHKLSHQHLSTTFWIVHLKSPLSDGVPWSTIKKYPVPVLIADMMERFKN